MIPIAKPLMGEAEAEAARRAILSGWVTQGPEVAAFEREFADVVGAPHACAVSNCTTALHLALLAAGVKPGDEVVTVSHSFIATANAHPLLRRHAGLRRHRAGHLQHRPGADRGGDHAAHAARSCASTRWACRATWRRIVPIARRHGLPVIEDAACAIGSEIQWRRAAGRRSAAARRRRLLLVPPAQGDHHRRRRHDHDAPTPTGTRAFRLLRQHGMSVPDTVRHGSSAGDLRVLPELGYNYRMTDIQAAVGREQLKRLPEMVAGAARALPSSYRALLGDMHGPRTAVRAGLGAHQLAELLRAPARRMSTSAA